MNLVRDIPPIRSIPYTLDAALYNHVRLAMPVARPKDIRKGAFKNSKF
jgi:hypothetical protein